MLTVTKCN